MSREASSAKPDSCSLSACQPAEEVRNDTGYNCYFKLADIGLRTEMEKIVINVSGQLFVTTAATLARFPHTRLGQLKHDEHHIAEYFFDADEEVFREVLRYHRTGELHAPRNMCPETFHKQLEFWNVSEVNLENCCQSTEPSEQELERQFLWFEKRIELDREPTRRDRVWYFLTDPTGPYTKHPKLATGWCMLYMLMVVVQTFQAAASTLPGKAQAFLNVTNATHYDAFKAYFDKPCYGIKRLTDLIEEDFPITWLLCVTFFTLEIGIRMVSCPSKRSFLCSIHMGDAMITLIQLLQLAVATVVSDFVGKGMMTDEEERHSCETVTILETIVFFLAELRCFRILALATVCR